MKCPGCKGSGFKFDLRKDPSKLGQMVCKQCDGSGEIDESGGGSASGGEADVTITFTGHKSLQNGSMMSYGPIEVMFGGEEVGVGSGTRGFNVRLRCPLGRHTIVLLWESHLDGRAMTRLGLPTDDIDSQHRSEVEFVLTQPGRCTIHLDYKDKKFRIRRIEPKTVGHVPGGCATMFVAGIGLLLLVGLVIGFGLLPSG